MKLKRLLSDFFNLFVSSEEEYTWKEIVIGLGIVLFVVVMCWFAAG
ncbi:MAG: hypothetical protein HQ522_16675 [Bacteroidetes bacterium]|nr:hypothetical protein [Bacteroidota bacterium]